MLLLKNKLAQREPLLSVTKQRVKFLSQLLPPYSQSTKHHAKLTQGQKPNLIGQPSLLFSLLVTPHPDIIELRSTFPKQCPIPLFPTLYHLIFFFHIFLGFNLVMVN